MIHEKNELINILSKRFSKLKKDQQCIFCKVDLYKGDICSNFGVIDRKENRFDRWYVCDDHRHIFDFSSIEDVPKYVQEFLVENRIIQDIEIQ